MTPDGPGTACAAGSKRLGDGGDPNHLSPASGFKGDRDPQGKCPEPQQTCRETGASEGRHCLAPPDTAGPTVVEATRLSGCGWVLGSFSVRSGSGTESLGKDKTLMPSLRTQALQVTGASTPSRLLRADWPWRKAPAHFLARVSPF